MYTRHARELERDLVSLASVTRETVLRLSSQETYRSRIEAAEILYSQMQPFCAKMAGESEA